ncbi:hypothetical protein ITJ38_17515 [Agreia pratensis]|uniref:ComEC/Rec2 family competence protein n=1 Tax=Agreia pratensis TaxID=150121 RepID=UPI00188CC966|nr:MBL fold metallo-hydrolase [Agreia pratensis]MBF4636212.1 hypothetical protein [Agreia pratensis]
MPAVDPSQKAKMYTIDFLAVENENSDSTKSGDAIVLNFTIPGTSRKAVVVIDGGYTATGQEVVDHVAKYCNTDFIDLVICTHPDSDHLNGLTTILNNAHVGELMMHTPWAYAKDANVLGNYENIVALFNLARSKGIPVTQPFTGETRFQGAVSVLGPTEVRYIELLASAIDEERSGTAAQRRGAALSHSTGLLTKARTLLERAVSYLPIETLSDIDDTSPRNQMSVITLLDIDGKRHLLTGDAGIASLDAAVNEYERKIGPISIRPLHLFQAPHHGSKHNLGPTVLDRILGKSGSPFAPSTSFISSAAASPKHPSPKVVNALIRRGGNVYATEARNIRHRSHDVDEAGWTPIAPLPPVDETD